MPGPRPVAFEESPHGAAAAGFDHFQASLIAWVTLIVVLCAVVAGAFYSDWRAVAAIGVATFVGVCALVRLLRFRIAVAATGVFLERSVLGLVYSRLSCADLQRVTFIVEGTGDWGDDGFWPGHRYCEVVAPGWPDAFIGSPAGAEALRMFLVDQRVRVMKAGSPGRSEP